MGKNFVKGSISSFFKKFPLLDTLYILMYHILHVLSWSMLRIDPLAKEPPKTKLISQLKIGKGGGGRGSGSVHHFKK